MLTRALFPKLNPDVTTSSCLMLSGYSLGHFVSGTFCGTASNSQQGNFQNKCIHQNATCIECLLCACSSLWASTVSAEV